MKKRKLVLIAICVAFSGFMGLASCKVDTPVEEVEKNKSTDPDEEDINLTEGIEVIYPFSKVSSSHCYDKVTLRWKNPETRNLDKVVLAYNEKTVELTDAISGEEITLEVEDLELGKETAFVITAYNYDGAVIDAVRVKDFAGHGKIVVKNETDDYRGRIITNNLKYATYAGPSGTTWDNLEYKEVVVVPEGTEMYVEMKDNCSYKDYVAATEKEVPEELCGAFTEEALVKIEPFAMAMCEMTVQQFIISDVSNWPTRNSDSSLKTNVNFLQAIKTCNDLTLRFLAKSDCYYYEDVNCTKPYSDTSKTCFYVKKGAKGYRLPTSIEWEFASRGGNPNSREWGWSYSGSNCGEDEKFDAEDFRTGMWVEAENGENSLGLKNMSGNVWEFVMDYNAPDMKEDGPVLDANAYSFKLKKAGGDSDLRYKHLNTYTEDLIGTVYPASLLNGISMTKVRTTAEDSTGIRVVRSL